MSVGAPRDLSRTKLYIPAPRADIVVRSRLLSHLADGLTHPLTLISAPAGYGKTTLLSHWLTQQHLPTAWLSLDQQDNDPIRFWTYVIAALQTVRADLGQTVLAGLRSLQPPPLVSVLPELLDQIGKRRGPLILVLDDYQSIHERAIHESLAFLLDYLPPQFHLVIATRADPPLPLARLRVRNQLVELRVTDLRFTAEEAGAFLDHMTGLTLSTEDVAALETRTEGWIAGLQLAAISMKGRRDIAGFVKAFAGSHLYVAEYLVEEVLQHQPEEVQQFLLQTSILERLTATLCEAVTGQQAGQAVLTALQRANLFVIPLDDEGQWFRYHHLFADLLQARLRQTLAADAIESLHTHAAVWYEQHGWVGEAVHHALAAKDHGRAAALVEQAARAMMFAGSVNTLRSWLEALPEQSFQAHPRLAIYRVWIDLMQGKSDLSEQAMQEKENMLKALPPSPENDQLRVELMVVLSRFVALSGNTARAIRFAEEALSHLPEADFASRARVQSALALAYGMEGRAEKADLAYRECLHLAQAAGNYSLAAHTTMLMAQWQFHYGQLHEAARAFQSIIDMGIQAEQKPFFPAGQGYIGLAGVYTEWNDLETAETYLKQGLDLCRQGGLAGLSTGYIIKSRLLQMKGDLQGALEALHALELEQLAQQWSDPTLPARQIQLRLAMGDLDEAGRWAMPFMNLLKSDAAARLPALVLEFFEATVIRVYLAQGEIAQAMQWLDVLQDTAAAGKRFGRLIEVYLLRALALQKQHSGNISPAALNLIEQALELAEPEGYIALFVEEGPAVIPLLKAVVHHSPTPERIKHYARRLLEAFPREAQAAVPHASHERADLIEPLTARESEVLQLIAIGDSNQTIADKLVITVSAVKKHTGNIFGKLHVKSRTQAIVRARQLGLLPTDK